MSSAGWTFRVTPWCVTVASGSRQYMTCMIVLEMCKKTLIRCEEHLQHRVVLDRLYIIDAYMLINFASTLSKRVAHHCVLEDLKHFACSIEETSFQECFRITRKSWRNVTDSSDWSMNKLICHRNPSLQRVNTF